MSELEDQMMRLLSRYVGKSAFEIEESLGERLNPDSKNYCRSLSDRILQADPEMYRQLRNSNISIKTVRLSEGGGPRESMSFPAFRFDEMVKQEWDSSDFKRQLSARFFFIIFENITSEDESDLVLKNAGFWSIPDTDLKRISTVWEDTKNKVLEKRYSEFIGKTKNPYAHVRPHGQSSADTYEYEGEQVKKYCFWLNNTYVAEIIRDIPNMQPYSDTIETINDLTMRDVIIKLLSTRRDPISSFKLKKMLSEYYPGLDGYEDTITGLIVDKVIENTFLGYRLMKFSLEDLLKNAPTLVKGYFATESIDTFCNGLNRSIEDVEIEVRSFFTTRPEEERFASDFSKYQFTQRQFIILYGVSQNVYRYLSLMHPKGWKNPFELLDDQTKSDSFKEKLRSMLFSKIDVDGTTVDLTEIGILTYLLSKSKGQMNYSELARKYKEFISKHGVTDRDISNMNATRIKSFVDKEDNYLLKTSANTVRYFPYNKAKVYSLLEKVGLERYKDMYISAELIRTDSYDLFDEYGLTTENDVYMMFYKYKDCKILRNYEISFPAPPSIRFGNGNLDQQLVSLLKETGRISKNDFCRLYSLRYGTKEMSVRAYMSKYPQYSNGEFYDIDLPMLPSEVIEFLRPRFRSAIISHSIAQEHFQIAEKKYNIPISQKTDPYYNIKNLSQLGYKMAQGSIFLDKYDSIHECIRSEYLDRDFVTIDSELEDNTSFKTQFNNCLEMGEYYITAPNEYIRVEKLHSTGVTDEMIEDYITNASTYLPAGTYFTLHYLHKMGFEHPLEEQGFEDMFYEGLIMKCSNIRKSDLCRKKVFIYDKEFSRNQAVIQMTMGALGDEDSAYVYDITEQVLLDYGIDLSNELKKEHKPMRYNKDTEKIYRDDTAFIEEMTRN